MSNAPSHATASTAANAAGAALQDRHGRADEKGNRKHNEQHKDQPTVSQNASENDAHIVNTVSSVARLEGAARIEEIARMLGGIAITPTTRRHAKEMLTA
jgi:DNA repair protein RecN (Recombination protein N)